MLQILRIRTHYSISLPLSNFIWTQHRVLLVRMLVLTVVNFVIFIPLHCVCSVLNRTRNM